MAVRTPSGKTLPGNLSIIPSEQKWVFHALYQHAFPQLYSSEVCFRNRLVLTDEDEAEYRSFEDLMEAAIWTFLLAAEPEPAGAAVAVADEIV